MQVTGIFGTDGTLSGNAGCNSYSASYTLDGDKMTISAQVSTRMYCAQAGVMEQEQAYLAALEQVATYRIDGDRLELRSAEGACRSTTRRNSRVQHPPRRFTV